MLQTARIVSPHARGAFLLLLWLGLFILACSDLPADGRNGEANGAADGEGQTGPQRRAAAEDATAPPEKRPDKWAQPIEKPGLPNLHKVSDALYRSAQPSAEGMREAEALGVKAVVNLRSFHSDRDLLEGLEMRYVHLYVKAWHPEDHEVETFLQTVADPANQPVLVHCQHGADRTGLMCAIYRVAEEGWSVDEAMREMTEGGYGFHGVWRNIKTYLQELDIPAARKRAYAALAAQDAVTTASAKIEDAAAQSE